MGTQTRFQISNFSRRKRNLRRKKSEEREFENTLARADFAYHPFPFFPPHGICRKCRVLFSVISIISLIFLPCLDRENCQLCRVFRPENECYRLLVVESHFLSTYHFYHFFVSRYKRILFCYQYIF